MNEFKLNEVLIDRNLYHVQWWNDGRPTFDRQQCSKSIQMCFNKVFFVFGENCTVNFASCYFLQIDYSFVPYTRICLSDIIVLKKIKIKFHLSCRTFKICKDESVFGNCSKVIHTWAIQHVKFHTFALDNQSD